ncbi:hypothetical protein 7F12_34 [uncultured Caudovirales phage]|uniref:Uncharacterized protein n=1 Tax=uncultured Caudovirales phage TaxID=2100421 RepID=A0A2H4JH86_9CAUD|nr:hypothetical protein 7F12_34 [uncultured Caudovirales phage]
MSNNQNLYVEDIFNKDKIDTSKYPKKELLPTLFKGSTKESKNNIKNKRVNVLSDYISYREFAQFEKRIDDKYQNIDKKLESLPNELELKFKEMLREELKELKRERKEDKKQIITWILTGTGLLLTFGSFIIAILGLLGKVFNWY